ARRAADGSDAFLDCLRLAHQRDVAGRGFVPAGGDADERLVDLLLRQPHRVIERAVRRALGAFGGVAALQSRFQIGLRVHRTHWRANRAPSPLLLPIRSDTSRALRSKSAATALTAPPGTHAIGVEKSYGQKGALCVTASRNNQMFPACCPGA